MKIKSLTLTITGFLIIIACKNEPEKGYDPVTNTDIEYSPTESGVKKGDNVEPKMELNNSTREATSSPDSKGNRTEGTPPANNKTISGMYVKTGEKTDANCGCYCLDLNFDSTSQMCLVPNEMYINTRLQKNSNNSIDVFLVGPTDRNTGGKDIPWDKFDKNTPIAQITPSSNGELELDWLGFKTNGDLAIDYAIYGKKTLEGNYKKK